VIAQSLIQEFSNLRVKKIVVNDTVFIDSVSLAIGSFSIQGIDPSDYIINPVTAQLYWNKKPRADSALVRYRVLPLSLNKVYSHKLRKIVDSNYVFSSGYYSGQNKNGEFVKYDPIEYNGSYGRGISLGNNQDVVLNSNFNLQVNGYIMDSIKVEAAITDNTIPFQPEGNTSTLQEFDQLSIRLSKGKKSLLLGDYSIERPNSYFINFNKRVQGIFYQTEDKFSKNISNKAGFSASMAKGEFARNIIAGSEGNQGPYRLTGNNGEQLFIVLAGTEKVYVDNILQERGENADYIINYNTNEIRFMPRRLITQNSRIQVEFEYRSNNYLNSLFYVYDELSIGKKWKVRLNAYSNQDAKNQPYQQNLTGDQKRFLAGIGDSIQNAYIPNISRDTLSASKILYRIADTIVGSIHFDSVYVYSTNATIPLYSVSFSYVGSGKGNYIISTNNTNGRAYQWIAPVAGIPQGDYSALSLIITPKMQQMFTLASTYQIDSFKKLNVELASSNKDPNLFSSKDNNDHWGLASKVIYDEKRFFGKKDSANQKRWTMDNSLSYEYVQSKFQAIAPYRAVEFGRDWNVPLSGASPDENWATISSKLHNQIFGTADYSFSYYSRGTFFTGYRNSFGYNYNRNNLNTGFGLSLMSSSDTSVRSQYLKPNVFLEYSFKRILKSVIGASYSAEHNEQHYAHNDSLAASSFYFDIRSLYLRSIEQKKYRVSLTYYKRQDYAAFEHAFQLQNHSNNLELKLGLSQWKNHNITFTGTYRQLTLDNTTVLNPKPEESLLGRLEYNGSIWHRVFSFSTLYEFGSGQEQKRSYTYVQVPAGQGVYNWIDYNNDGVQQLNEFVIALYPDQKLFIKIFTPTDEYNKVNNVSLNQTINFEPSNIWGTKNKNGFAQLAAKVSDQFSLQVVNKILSDAGFGVYNPIGQSYSDTSIIVSNQSINNTFYFNRSSSHWGLDYNFLKNVSKQLLTYGVTSTSTSQNLVKLRTALSKSITFTLSGKYGERGNQSGIADGSSYYQKFWSGEPALIWMSRSVLRLTTSLKYEQRNNAAKYGGEDAKISSANIDARYSKTSTGIIQLRFTYSNIEYNGLITAPVSYVMLDGLKTGNNFLWYLNWQRRVSKGIEMSIEYEGRKSGSDKVINTGRMSLKAIL
jgi:hypothetical protein